MYYYRIFYNENEEKYKVLPKLILPELACISCFEDSGLWHRAIVLKIVNEENVQVIKIFKYILININSINIYLSLYVNINIRYLFS